MVDDAVPYEWGEEYSGYGDRVYSFTINKKSNFYLKYTTSAGYGYGIDIYNSNGKQVANSHDWEERYNKPTDRHILEGTRILPAGHYFLQVDTGPYTDIYTLFATIEPAISLTRPTITSLKKGKTYYVRARAYAIYGAGNKVYSA